MYKINCYNVIKEEAKKLLTSEYIETSLEEADGVLIRSTNIHNIDIPENVCAIARAGIGVNTIPFENLANKGVVVFNTPGANANGVKEMTILGLILSQRDIIGSINWVKSIKDDPNIVEKVELEKSKYAGFELKGKNLGIIGLGAIGGLVANTAVELGMNVFGYDPYISITHAWGLSKNITRVTTLDDLYEKSDVITIHVPLKEDTKNMINEDAIKKMKDGIVIINFARDAIVSDTAIKDALHTHKVAKYITDFPNPVTVKMDNTIVIPHLGGSTKESENNCAIQAVRELMDYLENGNINNSVNYPTLDAGICRSVKRITINHYNVSGMISKFANILSSSNINIARMYNNSLDTVAYTILDLDSDISSETLTKLKQIQGVLIVRVLKVAK